MSRLEPIVVHCWEKGPDDEVDGMTTTCLLADEHDGPHEFTRDDGILITLPEKTTK